MVVLLGLWPTCGICQREVPRLPQQLGMWFAAQPLINPATLAEGKAVDFQLGTQRHFGPFNAFSLSYLQAGVLLKRRALSPTAPQNRLGLAIYSDQAGSLINRTYFYGQYAWRTRISEHWYLSAGGAMGFVSYTIRANRNSAGGADTQPDAYLGLLLKHEAFAFGLALAQVFNAPLQPIFEVERLTPHLNLHAEYRHVFNPDFDIAPTLLFRYSSRLPPDLDLGLTLGYRQFFKAGINYRHQKGMLFFTTIDRIRAGKFRAVFRFSYLVSFPQFSAVPLNRYEAIGGFYEDWE